MLELEMVYPLHVQLAGRVRQGCSLLPLLYLIYDETMIRETTDNLETSILVGGSMIYTTSSNSADDKTVVANCQKGLQKPIDDLKNVTR